MERPPNSVSDG